MVSHLDEDKQNLETTFPNRNVAQLVPTKSDQEYANELKARLLEAYKPVIEILTEAKRNSFEINVTTGANGFGIVQVANIQVLKVY